MNISTEQIHTITVNDAEKAQIKLALDITSEETITDRRKKLTDRNLQIHEDVARGIFDEL